MDSHQKGVLGASRLRIARCQSCSSVDSRPLRHARLHHAPSPGWPTRNGTSLPIRRTLAARSLRGALGQERKSLRPVSTKVRSAGSSSPRPPRTTPRNRSAVSKKKWGQSVIRLSPPETQFRRASQPGASLTRAYSPRRADSSHRRGTHREPLRDRPAR